MKLLKYLLLPLINHPLNSKRKILAVVSFFHWQIKLRLVYPDEIVVFFTNRSKFIVKKERIGLTGNLYCGLHEFENMMFLLHFLRSEDHFFDIGANVAATPYWQMPTLVLKPFHSNPYPQQWNY